MSRTWTASIGDGPAFEIVRQDESTLRLLIPGTLALGEHEVRVQAPNGQQVVLLERLRVVDVLVVDAGAFDVGMLDGGLVDASGLPDSGEDASVPDAAAVDAGRDAGDDAGALATCGDRVLDPGESCDDGNVASGDGCAADCQLELTRDACPGTPLVIGLGVQFYEGTLSPGASAVECARGIGSGPDRVYEISPSFDGSLNIQILPRSPFDAALMTRSACPGRTEYYCADSEGASGTEIVDGGVRSSRQYMVIASSAGPTEVGDYVIRFEGRL